jgi:hypothetical protein
MIATLLALTLAAQCSSGACTVRSYIPPAAVQARPAQYSGYLRQVVRISNQVGNDIAWGSGTVLTANDLGAVVLTARHLFVDQGDRVRRGRILVYHPGGVYEGKLLTYSDPSDMALVRIAPIPGMVGVQIAPEQPSEAWLWAYDGETGTFHRHRGVLLERGDLMTYSGEIHYGDSGGGIFNGYGYLAGVATAVSPGMAYAVPLRHLQAFRAARPASLFLRVFSRGNNYNDNGNNRSVRIFSRGDEGGTGYGPVYPYPIGGSVIRMISEPTQQFLPYPRFQELAYQEPPVVPVQRRPEMLVVPAEPAAVPSPQSPPQTVLVPQRQTLPPLPSKQSQ